MMLVCALTFSSTGAMSVMAADADVSEAYESVVNNAKSSSLSAKGYTINKEASNANVEVTITAKNGYKVYYSTTKKGFSAKKVINSGKSKLLSFSSAASVYIYAAKDSAKFSAKKAKKNADTFSVSEADLLSANVDITDATEAIDNLDSQYAYLLTKINETDEKAQTALDQQALQNIMSRHIMYHCYGYHEEEMNELWVTEDVNRKTASFGNSGGFWAGWDAIWESYVTNHDANWLSAAKSYCESNGIDTSGMTDEEILNTYGGVGQLLLHVITTDIIEISADGKTAKCFWYTPGIVAETGQSTNSIWEMYGVDFVKENGEWKMWHLHMYTDTMGQYGTLDRQNSSAAMHFSGQNIVGNDDDPTETYRMWSADRLVSEMATVLIPTPYDTWSWDDQNFGPSKKQWQTLIASEGWSDILAEWDAAH